MITGPMALVNTPAREPLSDPDRSFVDKGLVARGGTSEVRCVFDPRVLRKTALKRVDIRQNHPRDVGRFIDEARITGQLEHPNVVPVHEFGAARDGSLYISMKLIDGQTLAQLADAQETVTPAYISRVVSIVLRVCEALAHAHSRGVLHRDIKPENIAIGDYGEVYVLDWGSAAVLGTDDQLVVPRDDTTGDAIVGTPAFISPEQAMGDASHVDERTDVFGVGTLLYYCLTGQSPYGDTTVPQALFRAVAGEVEAIESVVSTPIPESLIQIVRRSLSRSPDDRYPGILELSQALEQFRRGTWSSPTRTFAAGETIIEVEAPAGSAWVVSEGTVEAWLERGGKRVVLRTMGPGEVFGEMAHLTGDRRSANVSAVTDVVLTEVSTEALSQGLGLNTWLGAFVRTLASRFRSVDAELRELQLTDASAEP